MSPPRGTAAPTPACSLCAPPVRDDMGENAKTSSRDLWEGSGCPLRARGGRPNTRFQKNATNNAFATPTPSPASCGPCFCRGSLRLVVGGFRVLVFGASEVGRALLPPQGVSSRQHIVWKALLWRGQGRYQRFACFGTP